MRSAQPQIPSLDAIGNSVSCSRLREERGNDTRYARRLALHVQTLLIETEDRKEELEKLLTAVLAIKVNPSLQKHPTCNSPE